MTHQNLVLTENAIKRHSKRLQKELRNYAQDLSLGEAQNIFSKTLGFNNFHELKKTLNTNTNSLLNSDKIISLIEHYEHKGYSIWISCNGDVTYNPHGSEIDTNGICEKNYLTEADFKDFTNYLLLTIGDYESKMNEKILFFSEEEENYYLTVTTKKIIKNRLSREPVFQIYFNRDKKVKAIKIVLYYKVHGNIFVQTYDNIKHLFFETDVVPTQTKRNASALNRRFFVDNENYVIDSMYAELYQLCIDGNLLGLKEHLAKNRDIDLNRYIPDRTWEPKTAIELALAFENFEVLNYMINNFKVLGIDLHSSNNYLLRHCCLKGSDEHFITLKKIFNNTSFKNISNDCLFIDTILNMSEKSNKNITDYLKSKTYKNSHGKTVFK